MIGGQRIQATANRLNRSLKHAQIIITNMYCTGCPNYDRLFQANSAYLPAPY
jgi:hypothetical protein